MSENGRSSNWIEDLEIENAKVKWAFSHFDGRADTFNDAGDHNFTLIIDDESEARRLMEEGWNIRVLEPREEGDPVEHLLKVKISYRYEPPKIYLIKGQRKFRADETDLSDISRATCLKLDVIIQPSPWVHGRESGVSAYAKEMYATVKESRFSQVYADFEEVR